MPNELLAQLPSLGISGLLFVMWWQERQERGRGALALREALQYARDVTQVNTSLLDVIRSNTEALTSLREELRAHRAIDVELLSRVARQLEELAGT
jgi:hypothetical protein